MRYTLHWVKCTYTCGVISLDTLTSLGQPTIRLRFFCNDATLLCEFESDKI